MNSDTQDGVAADDTDLTSYFSRAVERAQQYLKLLFLLTALFAVIVIVFVHSADPVYTAAAALTPPKDSLMDVGDLANVGSGLASSISRRFGFRDTATGSNEDLFDEYTRVLVSYRLAETLAAHPEFLALAFPDRWDPKTKHLRQRAGIIATAADGTKTVLGLPVYRASDIDVVYKFLRDNLSISSPTDPSTNISEISLRFNNGVAAQTMLNIILTQADMIMRTDKREDISARIAYLKAELGRVTQDDQKHALISLLTVQQSTMMILAADHRYASYIVEPPHAPQKPTWPTGGSVIGLIAFLAFVNWGLAINFLPEKWLATFSSNKKFAYRYSKKTG